MPKYYPVFLDLHEVPCLVVGGGEVALRKTESLIVCGADVTVISPEVVPGLCELWENKQISWLNRIYQPNDCLGFSLVIGATDQEEINARVAKECKAAGIIVNIVDDPQKCSFLVPSVFRRGDLAVAISTGGASPTTAKHIREQLERQYGPEYEDYLQLLATARKEVLNSVVDGKRRKQIFEQLTDGSLLRLIQEGRTYEAKEWVKKCLS